MDKEVPVRALPTPRQPSYGGHPMSEHGYVSRRSYAAFVTSFPFVYTAWKISWPKQIETPPGRGREAATFAPHQ